MDNQSVLFIQGAGNIYEPEGSGQLAAYLVRELSPDYHVIAPEMPNADRPNYQSWRSDRAGAAAIDEDMILVGHSFGGSVLLKYLAEGSYRKHVRGLFLVSVPNWGPAGHVRRIRGSGRRWLEAASNEDFPCTTVAMTRSAVRASRLPAASSGGDSPADRGIRARSSTGFRCSSTISRDCLFEDQLSCVEPTVVSCRHSLTRRHIGDRLRDLPQISERVDAPRRPDRRTAHPSVQR